MTSTSFPSLFANVDSPTTDLEPASSASLTLRWYQQAAVDATYEHIRTRDDNPCIVIPTAGGKSAVIAALIRDVVGVWGRRVMVLSHVKELLEQTESELKRLDRKLPVGVYSAGLNRRDMEHSAIIAGIQSVYTKAFEFDPFDLIVVDEAHLIPADGEGMYRKFLADAKLVNPGVRLVGLTATPYRLKSGSICEPDNLLNHVCFEVGVRDLIQQGYLSKLVSRCSRKRIETEGVKIEGGEYVAKQLEKKAEGILPAAVAEAVVECEKRKSVLVFTAGVENGRKVASLLEDHGESVAEVYGETMDGLRESAIEDFKAGRVKWLVNVNVLTTGFNATNIDAVVCLRPTMSLGLWYQMVGRGFRLHPGKENCIAEGQRVLTDHGLIPIERVTIEMKVWDGEEFVVHDGVVFQGFQEVITYAGLTATPDHRVWTKEGWKTIGECAFEQAAIAITGDGWSVVREDEGRFRRGSSPRLKEQGILVGGMHWMRRALAAGLRQFKARISRLPEMRQSAIGSQVACAKGCCCETTMHKSERCSIPRLWRSRHLFQFCFTHSNGGLDSREPWITSGHGVGSHRQQRPLLARQPEIRDGERAKTKHEKSRQKTKVYDILNAGPRRRFTVEGLLVSNCLVLDFGQNLQRHGPIDLIEPTKKLGKPGVAPHQTCPECRTEIYASYDRCPECDFLIREAKEKKQIDQTPAVGTIVSNELQTYQVKRTEYSLYMRKTWKEGEPRTMRVSYEIGWNNYIHEWVCFEHFGYAGDRARDWWALRSPDPFPKDSEHAVQAAQNGAVCETKTITVNHHDKSGFDRIVKYSLGALPPPMEETSVGTADLYSDDEVPF